MSMTGYTKLFSSIIASTIWRENKATKVVWITMLAMVDKYGEVHASIPGLADMARVSVDECRDAVLTLESPDPDSRTKDFEGRRIRPIDGGWELINFAKYRDLMSAEERKEYMRRKQAESRARRLELSKNVNNCQAMSKKINNAYGDGVNYGVDSANSEEIQTKEPVVVLDAIPESLNTPKFHEVWAQWEKHRKEKKSKLTDTTRQKQLEKMSKMGAEASIEAMNHSMTMGWIGLFGPTGNKNEPEPRKIITGPRCA